MGAGEVRRSKEVGSPGVGLVVVGGAVWIGNGGPGPDSFGNPTGEVGSRGFTWGGRDGMARARDGPEGRVGVG